LPGEWTAFHLNAKLYRLNSVNGENAPRVDVTIANWKCRPLLKEPSPIIFCYLSQAFVVVPLKDMSDTRWIK
jgi:hypothetical protein